MPFVVSRDHSSTGANLMSFVALGCCHACVKTRSWSCMTRLFDPCGIIHVEGGPWSVTFDHVERDASKRRRCVGGTRNEEGGFRERM